MPYNEIEILEELFTNGHYLWVSKISIVDGVRGSWYVMGYQLLASFIYNDALG